MKKREKIIVSFTVIAVLYGVYTYLWVQPDKVTKPKAVTSGDTVEKLNGLVKNATSVLKDSAEGSIANAYIIAMAENEWLSDPFYKKKKAVGPGKSDVKGDKNGVVKDALPEVDFRYTGYLEVGTKRMAIINGVDYETGGRLVPGGFVVREIYPAKVVIAERGGRSITIPFTEE